MITSYGLNLIAFIDVGSSFGVPSNLPTSPGGSGATCNGDPFCTVNANGTVTREYVVDTPLPRMSVGAGLLWMSGMGPIRLEFAYAAVRQEYDNPLVVRLHFSAFTTTGLMFAYFNLYVGKSARNMNVI